MQLICSAIGGVFAAICMLLLSPQLTQAALSFGPSELFAISFMGLSILTSWRRTISAAPLFPA